MRTRVFPAHAGMHRTRYRPAARHSGVPRTRGDAPTIPRTSVSTPSCSPHTRGCTEFQDADCDDDAVFPAHAGMHRSGRSSGRTCISVPRTRGDAPIFTQAQRVAQACSPHTRGCTAEIRHARRRDVVFPAHAGMHPRLVSGFAGDDRVPRTRGDAPQPGMADSYGEQCSPHTRGCTVLHDHLCLDTQVFPAHAGMHRQ